MKKYFQLNNKTHQFKNARDFFKVKKRDCYKLSLNITRNISISTTSISGNFQILNTKVCINEEILKTTNAPKWMQKERSCDSTNECKTWSKTNWLWKIKKNFSKLKCNLIKKIKMNIFFQYYKWVKRENQMKLLIVNFAYKQMIRAGKLEKRSQR